MTILDPCISTGESDYRPYDLGNAMDVWVKKQDGTPVVGRVWPNDPIHFADFSKPEAMVMVFQYSLLAKICMLSILNTYL